MVPRLLIRGVTAGAVILGAEALYAVLQPAPRQTEFDPSGVFGDPSHPPLRIAVLGDSSVTAPGVAGPEEIWVSIISQRAAQKRHVTLRSYAVSGSRADDLLSDQLQPAIAFDPDIFLVSVGANDVIHGVGIRVFERRLDELVSALTETGALVILSGVGDIGTIPRLKPPLRNLMTQRSARFDRAHHRVAARFGAHVVSHRKDDPTIWYTDRDLWSADKFHVSAAGHQRWADSTWHTFEPLLEQHG
ncbi:MAG TPA: SGNH/GDSL hydrolase family protein [Acidimicrobiia bacterium]|nr:SGNH/GDSL hydrolase family protein [Acidimicrobiia bacterium]